MLDGTAAELQQLGAPITQLLPIFFLLQAPARCSHAGLGVSVHIDGAALGHLHTQLLKAQAVHVGAAACIGAVEQEQLVTTSKSLEVAWLLQAQVVHVGAAACLGAEAVWEPGLPANAFSARHQAEGRCYTRQANGGQRAGRGQAEGKFSFEGREQGSGRRLTSGSQHHVGLTLKGLLF